MITKYATGKKALVEKKLQGPLRDEVRYEGLDDAAVRQAFLFELERVRTALLASFYRRLKNLMVHAFEERFRGNSWPVKLFGLPLWHKKEEKFQKFLGAGALDLSPDDFFYVAQHLSVDEPTVADPIVTVPSDGSNDTISSVGNVGNIAEADANEV
jgi:hypothetical protein